MEILGPWDSQGTFFDFSHHEPFGKWWSLQDWNSCTTSWIPLNHECWRKGAFFFIGFFRGGAFKVKNSGAVFSVLWSAWVHIRHIWRKDLRDIEMVVKNGSIPKYLWISCIYSCAYPSNASSFQGVKYDFIMQSHAWCIDFAQRSNWKFRKKKTRIYVYYGVSCLRQFHQDFSRHVFGQ